MGDLGGGGGSVEGFLSSIVLIGRQTLGMMRQTVEDT